MSDDDLKNHALPTSGPLGKRETYEPTNRDLLDNAYKQNGVINKVGETVIGLDVKLQTLAVTVSGHARVIDALQSIKTIAIWILGFVGIGGIAEVLNWLKAWLAH
jgi:hypothetical protein